MVLPSRSLRQQRRHPALNLPSSTGMRKTNPILAPPPLLTRGWRPFEHWGNGDRMQDSLVNTLRPMVFDSIISHIDWDACGAGPNVFRQPNFAGAFRRDSISFAGQLTHGATAAGDNHHTGHLIEPQDLTEAAIALEGLYLFESTTASWDFPGGRDHVCRLCQLPRSVVYERCIERDRDSFSRNAWRMGRDLCCGGDAHCGCRTGRQSA